MDGFRVDPSRRAWLKPLAQQRWEIRWGAKFPETNWARAFGVAAFDYDNDGWVDLVAVGETKDGKGEIRLFRNLGPDGFKDVRLMSGSIRFTSANPALLSPAITTMTAQPTC